MHNLLQATNFPYPAQMEQERLGKGQLTEEERAKAAADMAVRDTAALKRLEQSDEAKRMNQMVLRSQCMAIRWAFITVSKSYSADPSGACIHLTHWMLPYTNKVR